MTTISSIAAPSAATQPRPPAPADRRWRAGALFRNGLAAFLLTLALLLPGVASAAPGDVGIEGPTAGAAASPTGWKPQSKLWFNDGSWWGVLNDAATDDYYIWKLNRVTQTWSRTNTVVDTRNVHTDVLWDGTKLYVLSHTYSESQGTTTTDNNVRLYRFSYNGTTDTYSRDASFPVTIPLGSLVRPETVVLAKDSNARLWITWEQGDRIWLNRSTTNDLTWGAPFIVPGATAATTVTSDDISSIIAFGGNKIGVLWSNQAEQKDYFAVHSDSSADTSGWTIETAYSGTGVADDHVNLKADAGGRVYAVVKTSLTASSSPLVSLLARQTNGSWSSHTVATAATDWTRPILALDEANSLLRVYATSRVNGGTIMEKTSPLSSISFPNGDGTAVIHDDSNPVINDPTTSKHNATSQSGVIVLATNLQTGFYWYADLAAPAPPTAPTASAASATTPAGTPVAVTLSGVDPDTCDLTFAITTPPSHGTLAPIVDQPCNNGASPKTDSATVTYTPSPGYNGPDSFAYTVSDGADTSSPALASLTVEAPPSDTMTFTTIADARVGSNSPTGNGGTEGTLRTREEAGGTSHRSYLKFNVTGLVRPVTSVKLRLFVAQASGNVQSIYGVPSTWTETGITWNTAPPLTGSPLAGLPATPLGAYVEFDLPATAVAGNGTVSFGIKSDGTSSAYFNSREAATDRPQLVVTQESAPVGPTADFSSANPTGFAPHTVNFTDASVGTGLGWAWDFGDPASGSSNVSALQNPSHVYSAPGTYTVSLTVTDAATLSDVETKVGFVTVAGPTAQFTADDTSGTFPHTVNFTDQSTGSGLSWAWDFGDPTSLDNTSTLQNPSHTYAAPGTYTVSLTVTDVGLRTDDETKTGYVTVTVPPTPPSAGFSGTPLTGSVPQAVAFTDESTGGELTYAWDFGDGGTSTEASPSHTYTTSGRFTVSLTVDNPVGPPSTETKADYVTVDPTAAFTGTPTSGSAPLGVTFSNASVGTNLTYAWNFGDPGSGASNTSSLANPSHTYANPGTYTVSLTVTDEDGLTATQTRTSYITANAAPILVTTTFAPSADAQTKSNSATTNYGTLTTFRTRQDAPTGATYRSYLKFDVAGLTGPVVDVKLRLFVPSDDSPNIQSVFPASTAWIESGAGGITAANAPAFGAPLLGSGPATGSGTYIEIPLLDSAVPGNGLVGFGISSSGTNSAIFSSREAATNRPQLVVTYEAPPPGPTAAFTSANPSGTAPHTVDFVDQSIGSGLSWAWTFGDGGTSSAQNPSHEYTSPGTYDVSLTVTDTASATDVETKNGFVTISGPPTTPTAAFSGTPLTGQVPHTVAFTDASTGGGLTYAWDFGDGGTSSAASPSHQYLTSGRFTVSLTVSNTAGSDPEVKANYVTVNPKAEFTGTPTSGPAGTTVAFTNQSVGDTLTYAWTFGDGGTSTAANPSHQYAADGTYSVGLTVTDADGLTDVRTRTGYVTIASAPSTATFNATADAHVHAANPGNNYGALATLRVREEPTATGATYRAYVKFDLSSLSGTIDVVKLRLNVPADASANDQQVFAVADGWTETGLTWTNAPAIVGSAIGHLVMGAAGFHEITLDPAAIAAAKAGDGIVSIAIRSPGTDNLVLSSREGAAGPQLVITYTP